MCCFLFGGGTSFMFRAYSASDGVQKVPMIHTKLSFMQDKNLNSCISNFSPIKENASFKMNALKNKDSRSIM